LPLLLLLSAGRSAAFDPPCPDDARSEFGIVPFAKHDDGVCPCISFVSCMNLDAKKSATVSVQWFPEGPAPYAQVGTTVTNLLAPGEHEQFPTALMTSAPFISLPQGDAGLSGSFDLSGRVCASTRRLACHASLVCSCAAGPFVSPLTFVVKKQKGD
jgi:hypothetical protein